MPGTLRPLTEEQEAEIVARYQAGENVSKIGCSLHIGPPAVKAVLFKHGIVWYSHAKRSFSDEQREEITRRFLVGESCSALGRAFSAKKSTIRMALISWGVSYHPDYWHALTVEEEAEAVAAYTAGERLDVIAARYDCHPFTIRNIVRRKGMKPRKRGAQLRTFNAAELADLRRLVERGASQLELSRYFSAGTATIRRILSEQGLQCKTHGAAAGEHHRNWRGGRHINPYGYVSVVVPADHPYACMRAGNRCVLEHRLVMAEHLGRPLKRSEHVHHINGDRIDNRIENLQLRHGAHGNGVSYRCRDCGSHNIEPVSL